MINPKYIQIILSLTLVFLHQESLFTQCVENGNVWEKSWVSCTKTANPNPVHPVSHWMLYEFDKLESITSTHIWNANRVGESTMGIQDMIVDYSIDGTTWISLGSFTLSQATENANYSGAAGPDFGGIFVKKILFTVGTNHGHPTCASIAEIQFSIDQTSCYGIIDECNVCNGPGISTWYRDSDGDGLGDPNDIKIECTKPNGYVTNPDDICDSGILGWSEIGPLFVSNGCLGCHGNGGSGGLDLTSYASTSLGGNKCGVNLLSGNNLVGIITIDAYAGCSSAINGQKMNDRVGGAVDANELAMLQEWIDSGAPEYCQCPPGAVDSDGDGVCDEMDACPGFNNQLIGTSCNDGLDCTINDKYDLYCNCIGEAAIDSDADGVCDAFDLAPNDPCTADGTVDGVEPGAWTGSPNNDCDLDGIPLGQGDLDDFVACINQYGLLPEASCICGPSAKVGGGLYDSHVGVANPRQNAGGLPDGILCAAVGEPDRITLSYPYLAKNTVICITIGFNTTIGYASMTLNDIGTYLFDNSAGIVNYGLQEFCLTTIEEGPQIIDISKVGSGFIRVDGSRYEYCECSPSDVNELSPDCLCPSNQSQSTGSYVSSSGVTNAINGEGTPDNVFTAILGWQDTLVLSYPQLQASSKVCMTVGFNDANGVLHFNQSGQIYSFSNQTGDNTYAAQEYCFVVPEVLNDNLLTITEFGDGGTKIDGSIVHSCNECLANDPDSDGDGICDSNDPCPNSVNNDSDNDGICDDIDICIGFDDTLDLDNDGIPNGCDMCPAGDDSLDSDGDGIANACDQCPGNDDSLDFDNDGIPNACDTTPCLNFITDLTSPLIDIDLSANIQINTNGYVENNTDFKYTGGQTLLFQNGFNVDLGSTFLATIEPCPN